MSAPKPYLSDAQLIEAGAEDPTAPACPVEDRAAPSDVGRTVTLSECCGYMDGHAPACPTRTYPGHNPAVDTIGCRPTAPCDDCRARLAGDTMAEGRTDYGVNVDPAVGPSRQCVMFADWLSAALTDSARAVGSMARPIPVEGMPNAFRITGLDGGPGAGPVLLVCVTEEAGR